MHAGGEKQEGQEYVYWAILNSACVKSSCCVTYLSYGNNEWLFHQDWLFVKASSLSREFQERLLIAQYCTVKASWIGSSDGQL